MNPKKDMAIRISGLLQAIIGSGLAATPDDWEPLLKKALILHEKTLNKVMRGDSLNGDAKKD